MAGEQNLFDCFECGSCSFVCPAHIPLVQQFRMAKAMVRKRGAA
jgi:electron transport complex protein RnfC